MKLFSQLSLSVLLFIGSTSIAKVTKTSSGDTNEPKEEPKIESLFRYSIDAEGVGFQVYSGGCTCKKSFKFITNYDADEKLTKLTLVRLYPDHCKAIAPDGAMVWYSYSEMGLEPNSPFHIENPTP